MSSLRGRSPVYWLAVIGIFVLLGIDLFGSDPDWTDIAIIVLIVVAIFTRPGGLKGPRHAARTE